MCINMKYNTWCVERMCVYVRVFERVSYFTDKQGNSLAAEYLFDI